MSKDKSKVRGKDKGQQEQGKEQAKSAGGADLGGVDLGGTDLGEQSFEDLVLEDLVLEGSCISLGPPQQQQRAEDVAEFDGSGSEEVDSCSEEEGEEEEVDSSCEEEVKCRLGHVCARLTKIPPGPDYGGLVFCDRCEVEDMPNQYGHFFLCSACGYDVCPSCARHEEQGT